MLNFHDKHFSLPFGYRFLLKDIVVFIKNIDSFSKISGEKILDIGCGDKPYEKYFSKFKYIGVDNNSEKKSRAEIISLAEKLPFNSNYFDAVMTTLVLDDIFPPEDAIIEISRVLKRGGHYFAVEAQSAQSHNYPNDYFRFTPGAIKKLCAKHGLELVEYKEYAGDFGNIGFSFIIVFRNIFGMLRIDKYVRPVYSLIINSIFRPLDVFFRKPIFKERFKCNSLGYTYIFKKII